MRQLCVLIILQHERLGQGAVGLCLSSIWLGLTVFKVFQHFYKWSAGLVKGGCFEFGLAMLYNH